MHDDTILLSAVVVVGSRRHRAQRVLDALSSQKASRSMEIVVVDLSPAGTPRLKALSGASTRYLELPGTESFGRARAEGTRHALAPVGAFIEGHCIPAPNWAEALIGAHKAEWGG